MTERSPGPEDYDKALTKDRLRLVGEVLARAQDEARQRADRRQTRWSIGCDAYDFARSDVEALATEHSWIRVVNATMEFQFQIGNTIFRHYHGDADSPSPRHCRATRQEYSQASWEFGQTANPLVFRFAVETDAKGATGVYVVVATEGGSVQLKRSIWERGADGPVGVVDLPAPVQPGPPPIAFPALEEQRRSAEGGNGA